MYTRLSMARAREEYDRVIQAIDATSAGAIAQGLP